MVDCFSKQPEPKKQASRGVGEGLFPVGKCFNFNNSSARIGWQVFHWTVQVQLHTENINK